MNFDGGEGKGKASRPRKGRRFRGDNNGKAGKAGGEKNGKAGLKSFASDGEIWQQEDSRLQKQLDILSQAVSHFFS